MKKFLLATAASALLAPAAMADGFTYHGAEIDGQFWYNTNARGNFTTHTVRATAQFAMFGGLYFIQPEASLYDWDFNSTGISFGGHVGVMPTPNFDVGLFATYNTWLSGGSGDLIFGPEAKGTSGAVTWEAYLALFYNWGGGGLYGGVGRADIWYEVDERIDLHGGFGLYDSGRGGLTPQYTLGAAYDLTDSVNLAANYTYTDAGVGGNHGFGVKLTKTFDRGVTFGPRDYMSVRLGF